jgi:hypothetical protein
MNCQFPAIPTPEQHAREQAKAPDMFALLDRMVHTEGADWMEFAKEAVAIVKFVKGEAK